MSFFSAYRQYQKTLSECLERVELTRADGVAVDPDVGFPEVIARFKHAHANGGKIIFMGNGGSAAIASHQAFDYWKNGKLRALCFNDPSLLTGSANDFGYPNVFAKPIEMFAKRDDVLVIISSSGQSANVIQAAEAGINIGCYIVTLSAFATTNQLRQRGDLNIYLNTGVYGHAEIGHLTVLHTLLDFIMAEARKFAPTILHDRREKIVTPTELSDITSRARLRGQTVVHCHGVFDLVHPGHVNYFEQAKRMGDLVYVGVIADRFVRKGPGRPRFPERIRAEWVAALASVDYVVVNEEEGPWSLMKTVRPHVYVKCECDRAQLDDPTSGLTRDKQLIEELGGRLQFVPEEIPIHSSDLFAYLGNQSVVPGMSPSFGIPPAAH